MHKGFIRDGGIHLAHTGWHKVRFPCTVAIDWNVEALGFYGADKSQNADKKLDAYVIGNVLDASRIASINCGRIQNGKPVILVQVV